MCRLAQQTFPLAEAAIRREGSHRLRRHQNAYSPAESWGASTVPFAIPITYSAADSIQACNPSRHFPAQTPSSAAYRILGQGHIGQAISSIDDCLERNGMGRFLVEHPLDTALPS